MQIISLLTICLPLFLVSERYSASERAIRVLQDQRSLGQGKLLGFLHETDPRVRALAAIALGNIQDTTKLDALLPVLQDRSERVRAAAAWALGQLGHRRAQGFLLARLKEEPSVTAARRMVEALGKCADDSTLRSLLDLRETRALSGVRGEVLLTVGRCALRGIKTKEAVAYCFRHLTDTDVAARWRALYALWRSAPYPPIEQQLVANAKLVRSLITDRSPDVRMHLATLLGKCQSTMAFELLRALTQMEAANGEWRVRVQIARALGSWGSRQSSAIPLLLSYLENANDHVRIATLQSLRTLTIEQIEPRLHAHVRQHLFSLAERTKPRDAAVRGEAIITFAKLFPDDFPFTNLIAQDRLPLRLRSDVVEALRFIPSARNLYLLLELATSDSISIARTAWETIPALLRQLPLTEFLPEETGTRDLPAIMFRRLKGSLLRDDMAITTAVAQAVSDSVFISILQNAGYREQAIEELMLSYTRLSSPNDTEAMHAIIEALGKYGGEKSVPVLERALQDPDRTVAERASLALEKITGRTIPIPLQTDRKPLSTDYDWKTLESLKDKQRVRIRTTRGSLVIELLPDHAPFSVLSFVKLVRKGFYDGLIFHRVVPNFVIQGGDPRGDGWGGPGYSLRSEWSMLNYERGSVGLASAGKDTEGSQFFITHSPQPHLDGRYTIFARLVAGQEVVDAIQRGDRIVKVEIEQGN